MSVLKIQPSRSPYVADERMERKAPWDKVLCLGIFPGYSPMSTLAARKVFSKHKSSHATLNLKPFWDTAPASLPTFFTFIGAYVIFSLKLMGLEVKFNKVIYNNNHINKTKVL